MDIRLKLINRSKSGKSEIVVMAIIGLLIAAAITYFLFQIIGHSEEHVEKVKKAKIFYRESLTWRPDSKLCEKRIYKDLVQKPKRKQAKYEQLTLSTKAMKYIGRMSNLKILALSQSKFDEKDLKHLTNLPLKSLLIHGTPVTDEGIKYITSMKSLRKLEIGDTEITDAGLKELSNAKNIIYLDLELSQHITDEGISYLVKMQDLDTLNLSLTKVTSKSIDYLAKLKKIRRLRLQGINLNPEDLRKFKDHKLFHLLQVSESNISDSHLEEIGKLNRLISLNLSMNKITDEGLLNLKNLKNLKFLAIKDCPSLTAAGVNKLKKFLPNCDINFKTSKLLDVDIPVYELKQEVKLFETRELKKKRTPSKSNLNGLED